MKIDDEKYGFIEKIIKEDLGDNTEKVITRFPPEPNGYLHIGHVKAICVNFGIRDKFKGQCNLRFDDTNPSKESIEYVKGIKEDITWLGFSWDKLLFASSYFSKIYDDAIRLIMKGKAYVCDLSVTDQRKYRGTLKEIGIESPYRNRSIKENLELFKGMKEGLYDKGSKVLRAKIDMASPNLNLRDPIIYRILNEEHQSSQESWVIFPMYDFAHPLEDAYEGVTHSLCSLEFEDHKPLYNWFLNELGYLNGPRQVEFARLNINYTIMSKRKLLYLVEKNLVSGWDDPRLPTVRGMRRRGYSKDAIRKFVMEAGVSKSNSTVDYKQLEACVRDELNTNSLRTMCIKDPLVIEITNYEGKGEILNGDINPEKKELGKRDFSFSKELLIEKSDFMIEPTKGYRRLFPGNEVRFKDAYYVKCTNYDIDDSGNVIKVYGTYDKNTKGGWSDDGRRVKGTIHWVDKNNYKEIEIRDYNNLFLVPNPEKKELQEVLNNESLIISKGYIESSYEFNFSDRYQFLRIGYYSLDKDSFENKIVFNKIVGIRDSFNKKQEN